MSYVSDGKTMFMTTITLMQQPWIIASAHILGNCNYVDLYRGREIQKWFHYNYWFFFHSFPKKQILGSSKVKEFADDNFKFEENGRKLSKRVENTVGKGEIARYECF